MTYDNLHKIIASGEPAFGILFPEDCRIIQRLVRERFDVPITLDECQDAWQRYSQKQDAHWLDLKACTSQEILDAITEWAKSLFKPVTYCDRLVRREPNS